MRSETLMVHKGYKAQIMEAQRLVGDQVFGLPPGTPLPVYHSDAFVEWPKNWMQGPGVFVVPVKPNKGLWFNWRDNDEINTAIIPTVKGCNPITGLQTSGFHLERYDIKCPKHGCGFQGDRYCPECGYKWPDRNYVSMSPSWWDGFRVGDSVRQFFFTEEELRDVATHLIGKENTCPAFGFAFYKPKIPRPSVNNIYRSPGMFEVKCSSWTYSNNSGSSYLDSSVTDSFSALKGLSRKKRIFSGELTGSYPTQDSSQVLYSASAQSDMNAVPMACAAGPADSMGLIGEVDCERGFSVEHIEPKAVKEVSIGAGAKVSQALIADPYKLDTWCDAPEAVMTIYFVFQEKFEELKAGGMRDLEGKPEGMLSGIPVG